MASEGSQEVTVVIQILGIGFALIIGILIPVICILNRKLDKIDPNGYLEP